MASASDDRPTVGLDPVARAKEYVQKYVAPRELQLDAEPDPEKCFDWELIEAAHEYGLRTLMMDKQYGGEAVDLLTFMRVAEELGKGDLGIAGTLTQVNKLATTIQDVGTQQQKETILPQIRSDAHCALAWCSTEPDFGSDRALPQLHGPNPTKNRTRAVKVDGGWQITGTKIYIDEGNIARYLLVMAQTDESEPYTTGSTTFIVERGNPGLSSPKVFDKMGRRLGLHTEVVLDQCFVRDEDVLGEVNRGPAAFASRAGETNVIGGATALGVGEAAYECAVEYATHRIQGGRRLIDHGVVRHDLAKARMHLDAARAYVNAAAAAELGQIPKDPNFRNFTSVLAGQAAFEMALLAMELHGARGYTRGWRVEKLVRDAASFDHAGTPNRTALLKAAREMYGDATASCAPGAEAGDDA